MLEVGCGFGSLTAYLKTQKFDSTGIDIDVERIIQGKTRFPETDLRVMDIQKTVFGKEEIDTVIFRESLHHLLAESDRLAVLQEVKRITRTRLIVIDPNPTLLLKGCRWLIRHHDPECTPKQATEFLEEAGFIPQSPLFFEGPALAVSGGYIGIEWVPRWPLLYPMLLAWSQMIVSCVNALSLGETFLWRYLIIGDHFKEGQ